MPPFADPGPYRFLLFPDDALASPLPAAPAEPDLASPAAGRYSWSARELDAHTGLQYNHARYYCEAPGTWTTEDPLGFTAADQDLYRYPGSAPDAEPPQ